MEALRDVMRASSIYLVQQPFYDIWSREGRQNQHGWDSRKM